MPDDWDKVERQSSNSDNESDNPQDHQWLVTRNNSKNGINIKLVNRVEKGLYYQLRQQIANDLDCVRLGRFNTYVPFNDNTSEGEKLEVMQSINTYLRGE